MPVAKGYPRKVRVKGRGIRYRMHKGGKSYTVQQMKAYFATGGWRRKPRKSLRRRRRTRRRRR